MKGNEKLPAGQPGGRPLPGEGAFGLPAGHPGCRVPGVSTPGAGYANTVPGEAEVLHASRIHILASPL